MVKCYGFLYVSYVLNRLCKQSCELTNASAKCTAGCSCSTSSSIYVNSAPEPIVKNNISGRDQYWFGTKFSILASFWNKGTYRHCSVGNCIQFLLKKRGKNSNFEGFKYPSSSPMEVLRGCCGQDLDIAILWGDRAAQTSGERLHSCCVICQLWSEMRLFIINQMGLRKSSSLVASSPKLKSLTLLVLSGIALPRPCPFLPTMPSLAIWQP